jgi:glycine/D-amino acid oxidase-like deaminating enzyme
MTSDANQFFQKQYIIFDHFTSLYIINMPQHVVVIGAGAVGASVAYFLSKKQPDLKITVVEKTGIAQAASGKSGGFLALDW